MQVLLIGQLSTYKTWGTTNYNSHKKCYITIRMTNVYKNVNTKCCEGYGAMGTLLVYSCRKMNDKRFFGR